MKKSPASCRASASAGRTQTGSNCSVSSATGVWPSGMRATRKGTSKRRGRSRSVIQCASTNTSVGRQRQAARRALRGERAPGGPARRCRACVGVAAVGMARQQHAEFLETLADGGDGLRQVQVALAGAARATARGLARRRRRCRRRERRRRRAQSWPSCERRVISTSMPSGAVAQQQHGGGGAGGRGLALRVKELGGSWHFLILQRNARMAPGHPKPCRRRPGAAIPAFARTPRRLPAPGLQAVNAFISAYRSALPSKPMPGSGGSVT